MSFGTVKYFSFFYILFSVSASAQVSFELGFDAENSILQTGKESSKTLSIESIEKEFSNSGFFELSSFPNASPAGGNYLRLNGINHFVQLPASFMPNISGKISFTFSTWIFTNDPVTNGEVINADDGFISGYRFYIDNNIPKLEIREGFKEVFSSDYPLSANKWAHIGFYCDGLTDEVLFYVNGQNVRKLRFTKVSQVPGGKNAFIGAMLRTGAPNYLNANLDKIRFYMGKDSVFRDIEIMAESNSAIKSKSTRAPSTFVLFQNYPNPFNLSTKIQFELRKAAYLQLSIYDLLGNQIRNLYEGDKLPGTFDFTWDGADSRGNIVPSGVYFTRLSADGVIQTKKMILVK